MSFALGGSRTKWTMLFTTWQFAVFFAIVFLLYLRLSHRAHNLFLLAASWFFYASWDWRFLSLLLLSTVIDYWVGRLLAGAEGQRRRRLVTISVVANLAILGCFKYLGFFIETAAAWLQWHGLEPHLLLLRIVLPVGISFYTFQSMAYTIDVSRGDTPPTLSFVDFALYVAYFPQLVAGPIERSQDLLPQLQRPRRVSCDQVYAGAFLVLIGLVRKIAIADFVAPRVDEVFAAPEALSSLALLRGVVLFAIQIYGDFAGYTDIARGVSRMMGIELIENFRQPYFSLNVAEFWSRWHISLSRWLRVYLYIPLGGNRGPRWFVYRNLMLTMLLGGLWHGASWNFVIWGGLHGLALIIHRRWSKERPATSDGDAGGTPRRSPANAGVSWLLTMLVVGLGWVIFRAPSLPAAGAILGGILDWRGGFQPVLLATPALMLAMLLFIDLPQYRHGCQEAMLRWPWPLRGVVYCVLILALVVLRRDTHVPFIYFQF